MIGDVWTLDLVKGSHHQIDRGNYDKKKIKGIYSSEEEKLWFCDINRLYYKYGKKDKCFNLERIEKVYSKFSR